MSEPAGTVRSGGALIWLIAGLLVAVAVALRSAILFSSQLPPGIDAAYYPLQTRGLLETGRLPYTDLPLMFWLNAAVAKGIMLSGQNIDDATLLASRLIDAACEPLCVIPLALLLVSLRAGFPVRAQGGAGAARFPIGCAFLGALAIAVLSPPILRMTGDFEKNSLGLVWMASSAWAAYRAVRTGGQASGGRWGKWVLLAVFLVLSALTHIGAFGVTVVLVGSFLAIHAVVASRLRPRTILLAGLAGIVGAGLLWVVVYSVAPYKATGLVQGVGKMFTVGDRPQGPSPDVGRARPGDRHEPQDAPGQRGPGRGGPRGGPPGGPPTGSMPVRAALWAGLLCLGSVATWRARRIGAPELAIVCGATATSLLITCPFIQGQYAERLALMTPIPLSIVVGFLLLAWTTSPRVWVRGASGAAGALLAAGLCIVAIPTALRLGPPNPVPGRDTPGFAGAIDRSGPPGGGGGQRPGVVVDDAAIDEFRSMRGLVPADGTSVVVARHGLQWWAGYFLKVPVREEHATQEQLLKYGRVFVLREKSRRSGPGGDPGEVQIPDGAQIVHDGRYYTLAETPGKRSAAPN